MTQKLRDGATDAVRDISERDAKSVLLELCDTEDQHLLCEIATVAEKFSPYNICARALEEALVLTPDEKTQELIIDILTEWRTRRYEEVT